MEGVIYINTDSNQEINAKRISETLMSFLSGEFELSSVVSRLKRYDKSTYEHSINVAILSMLIAEDIGKTQKEVGEIGLTGLLHDIGKYNIPLRILNKPGKLTAEEYETMKTHSLIGYQMVANIDLSSDIKNGILQHHERLNGSGYPYGLSSSQIHPYARIIAVADVFDALMSKRSYKDPWSKLQTLRLIMQMTNSLDFELIQSLIRVTNVNTSNDLKAA